MRYRRIRATIGLICRCQICHFGHCIRGSIFNVYDRNPGDGFNGRIIISIHLTESESNRTEPFQFGSVRFVFALCHLISTMRFNFTRLSDLIILEYMCVKIRPYFCLSNCKRTNSEISSSSTFI
jgi:hypothetical protein